VADQQRMPFAPPPKAPTEIWIGLKPCGCVWEYSQDAPNAVTVVRWRASGITKILQVDAQGIHNYPGWCDHPESREAIEPLEDEPMTVVKGTPPPDPAPEGVWRAVCVDEYSLGEKDTKYGKKTFVQLVWEIEELNPKNENKPFLVFARFGQTLGRGSKLKTLLELWRGQKFTPEDIKAGFDLDKIVGAPCMLQIIHNTQDDGTVWANIGSIMPMKKGDPKLAVSGAYTRKKDRKEGDPSHSAEDEIGGPDDDIPF
jgi:hypothetical protein